MIKVENRHVIRRITKAGMRSEKKRNVILTIAVIMTTFLLTTIFSIGISYLQSISDRALKMNGADYDAVLRGPLPEQQKKAASMPNIETAGLYIGCSQIVEQKGIPTEISLVWTDSSCWQNQIIPAMESVYGTYPQEDNEIMLSKKALKELGIQNPKTGMQINNIKYVLGEAIADQPLILSGWFHNYSGEARGYVSESFFKKSGTRINDINNSSMYLSFKNPYMTKKYITSLKKELNVNSKQVFFADTEIIQIALRMLLGLTGLACLIILCAYLLIFNLMNLSVAKDIRYYGLLKTIGITSVQVKQIIKRQILLLASAGIPAGLILGAIFSIAIVPAALKSTSFLNDGQISFHPIIFIGAAAFSYFTVMISVSRPIRIARHISPVEATRFTAVPLRQKDKKGTGGARPIRMAWKNVFQEKKKATIVFLSLLIGIASFVCFTGVISSNGADNVLNSVLNYDITITNKTMLYENQYPEQRISDKLIADIRSIEGVSEVRIITANTANIPFQETLAPYFKAFYDKGLMYEGYQDGLKRVQEKPDDFLGLIHGIDEQTFDMFKRNGQIEDSISKKAFMKGEFALVSGVFLLEPELEALAGQTVIYSLPEGKTDTLQTAEINGAVTGIVGASARGFWPDLIVSKTYAEMLLKEPTVDNIKITYKKSYDYETEAEIKALIEGDALLGYESKIDLHKEMTAKEKQLYVLGGSLVLILVILGMLNYINMMTTNIQNRKNELAILKSIGMTSKQQRNVLIWEGLIYGSITLVGGGISGYIGGYFLFRSLDTWDVAFILPFAYIIIFFVFMLIICAAVPPLIFRLMDKNSIIEQLREAV